MSWQMTSAVKEHMRGEDPAVKLTAMCLADYANPEGDDIYPSVATLAEHVGVSPRSMQRHIARLLEVGFITLVCTSRGGSMPRGAGAKRRGLTNRYRINAEWWKRCPAKLAGHAVDATTDSTLSTSPVTRYHDTAVSPEDSIQDSIRVTNAESASEAEKASRAREKLREWARSRTGKTRP